MGDLRIQSLIKCLAEDLIFAEVNDLQALATISTRFERLAEWAKSNSNDAVYQVSQKATKILENIILDETDDPQKALEIIGKTVAVIQTLICEDIPLEEVDFPPELCIEPAGIIDDSIRPTINDGSESGLEQNEMDEQMDVESNRPAKIYHPLWLPPNVDEWIFNDFLARQTSVLEEIEADILYLENNNDSERFLGLKRSIHTLKGEASLLGLTEIQQLCHSIEDLLNRVELKQLIDLLLEFKDCLMVSFESYGGKREIDNGLTILNEKVQNFHPKDSKPAIPPDEPETTSHSAPLDMITECEDSESPNFRKSNHDDTDEFLYDGDLELFEEFITESLEHLENVDVHLLDIETEPSDSEAINAVFRAFHTIKSSAAFLGFRDITILAHESENLLDKARKSEITLQNAAIDIIFEVVDALRELISIAEKNVVNRNPVGSTDFWHPVVEKIEQLLSGNIPKHDELELEPSDGKLGEILIKRGLATKADMEKALQIQKESPKPRKLGEILITDQKIPAKNIAKALRSQKQATLKRKAIAIKETVKVDAQRLDRLVDTIGELVIAETMVSQSPELQQIGAASLTSQLNQLDKITRELQEMATSLRMMPISGTFHKMARLVRDLSKKIDKPVDFAMTGEETELDKSVIDGIGDPLIHLLRNAIDHGIEAPTDRLKAGKSAKGKIELRAFHRAGKIHIEVEDDGRGIDRNAILQKALEKGMIARNDILSEGEIYNLMYEPGFSTAKKVTSLSGRGVGMDVVKKNIESLHGRVEIKSEFGKGSMFSMQLPLTLAIIDGMVIRVGRERLVIPTLSIIRSMKPSPNVIHRIMNHCEVIDNQEEIISIIRLDRLLGIESRRDIEDDIVVIVEADGKRSGIVVDEIIQQQQIVIKPLGNSLGEIPGIAGGTIMPDGAVGLILDVAGIVKIAQAHPDVDNRSNYLCDTP